MAAKREFHHKGSSINKARQEGPHAHQVAIHPNKKDVYVCDLGIDTVKAYYFKSGELIPNERKDCHVPKEEVRVIWFLIKREVWPMFSMN